MSYVYVDQSAWYIREKTLNNAIGLGLILLSSNMYIFFLEEAHTKLNYHRREITILTEDFTESMRHISHTGKTPKPPHMLMR